MQCSLSSAIARLEGKLVLSQAAEGLIRAALTPYQRRFRVLYAVSPSDTARNIQGKN